VTTPENPLGWLFRTSDRSPRWLGHAALLAVLVLAWWSATSLELQLESLRWWPLAAATSLTGAMLLMNALEYRASAAVIGRREQLSVSLRIAVHSSVANLLPIPAGVAIRLRGLHSAGATAGAAIAGTVVVGGTWMVLAALLASAVFYVHGNPVLGSVLAVAGAVVAAIGALVARSRLALTWLAIRQALVAEAGGLFVATLRVVLTGLALGLDVTVSQGALIAAVSVLAAMIGLIPGGTGVWEALSAGAAQLVGLSVAEGFLVAAVVRMQNLVGLTSISGILHFTRLARRKLADS
jgi:hypothetical protein